MGTDVILKKGKVVLDLGTINQFITDRNRNFYDDGELDSRFTNLISSFKEDLYNLLIYRPTTENEFRETLEQLIDDYTDCVDSIGRSYVLNNLIDQVDKVERR